MRTIAFLMVCVWMLAGAGTARAQSWQPPADSQRCPSKWGPADERGAANHMKPDTVLRAVRLIRTGQVFELGRELSESIPMQATRTFHLYTKRTAEPQGSNRRGGNEEVVFGEIGQVGTQFDGFAHQTIGDSMYNCVKVADVSTRTGFTKLGIQNIGTLITRGVLVDVAAFKGVEMLPDTYEITAADLQQSLARQQLTLQPGDAVLIHTGWGRLWGKENGRYMKVNPGIGPQAAEWLAQQDVMIIGADNPPVNATPSADPKLSNPTHQIALVVYGIFLLENLRLDELAAQRVYEFALMVQPLKLQGGTGSTVAPVAVR